MRYIVSENRCKSRIETMSFMNGLISFHLHSVRLPRLVFTVVLILCCASPTSSAVVPVASQPAPTPHTPIQHTPSLQFDRSSSFSAQVGKFGIKARELMKGLQIEMMSLMGWVEYLALVL